MNDDIINGIMQRGLVLKVLGGALPETRQAIAKHDEAQREALAQATHIIQRVAHQVLTERQLLPSLVSDVRAFLARQDEIELAEYVASLTPEQRAENERIAAKPEEIARINAQSHALARVEAEAGMLAEAGLAAHVKATAAQAQLADVLYILDQHRAWTGMGWEQLPVPVHAVEKIRSKLAQAEQAGDDYVPEELIKPGVLAREVDRAALATQPAPAAEHSAYDTFVDSIGAHPTREQLSELYREHHAGHPADFALDVLERWGPRPAVRGAEHDQ